MFKEFVRAEEGAITVDWVVLSAAMAGLTIAAVGQLNGGIEFMMNSLDGQLGTSSISTPPPPVSLLSMDFDDGSLGDWTQGAVQDRINSLGNVLIVGPGQTTEFAVDFPSGRSTAKITFDLIGGDSLDNEYAAIKINGHIATLAQGMWGGTMDFHHTELDGVSIETEVISEGTNLGGASPSSWKDSVTKVTITVTDPGDTLTFSLNSQANQSITDEFFGIDNFGITALY